jgi:hypothetical protein
MLELRVGVAQRAQMLMAERSTEVTQKCQHQRSIPPK